MQKRTLMMLVMGAFIAVGLSGCISGTKPVDTYVGRDGKETVIESDKEMCKRSCNDDYSRCMDSSSAVNNDGQQGPSGVFGASGECRTSLKNCLPGCKAE